MKSTQQKAMHRYRLADDGTYPNNVLPLLVYPSAVDPAGGDTAAAFERIFAANGWPAAWRNGIYPFHHYHSTAHEVLGISQGHVRIQAGGPSGPILELAPGMTVIIPAGVAHRSLDAGNDLIVVGAYPKGQRWDMNDGRPGERPRTDDNIRHVPLPDADPVYGNHGPMIRWWSIG